jgi:hypothetical protein
MAATLPHISRVCSRQDVKSALSAMVRRRCRAQRHLSGRTSQMALADLRE